MDTLTHRSDGTSPVDTVPPRRRPGSPAKTGEKKFRNAIRPRLGVVAGLWTGCTPGAAVVPGGVERRWIGRGAVGVAGAVEE
jgi:hypothetical protein